MSARGIGLTRAYNMVHSAACHDTDVVGVREAHSDVDQAIAQVFGWVDLSLEASHRETRQGTRWAVSEGVAAEIVTRLLELNLNRHADERRAPGTRRRAKRADRQAGLFEEDE